jgi:purine nucleosidase
MTKIFLAVLLVAAMAAPASAAPPLHVIFDTDMGNDVDDALALAMLHAFASRGEVKLLAVTVSKDNPWAAEYVRLVDEYYGRASIPVGIVHDGKTKDDGLYVRQVCELHGRRPDKAAVQDAVELLRKTLAGESDDAVTLIQVGFSTNLARLLDSAPDSYSNLSGMELVKKKVRLLTVMAGNFAEMKPGYSCRNQTLCCVANRHLHKRL